MLSCALYLFLLTLTPAFSQSTNDQDREETLRRLNEQQRRIDQLEKAAATPSAQPAAAVQPVAHCLLRFAVVLRLDVAAFGSQTGLYELSADRALALTPFRLRAFWSRGSPSAWFTRPPTGTAGLMAAS